MSTMENTKPRHSLDNLSLQQFQTLTDIKDFINLYESQILEHIYFGNVELFNYDIRYLVRKGIIAKYKLEDAYYITKAGSRFVALLTGDFRIYNKLAYSRLEELSHDTFIYTTFKHLENELESNGKIITCYKTIRIQKSEDMRINGTVRAVYPNLFVEYVDENTGEKSFINIAVCLNGRNTEVLRKFRLQHLIWYTHKEAWKDKIKKIVADARVRVINRDDVFSCKH